MEKIFFTEEQRFNQWWLWLILILAGLTIIVPFSIGIYTQEVLHKPFGENPMSTEGLIVTGVFSVLLLGIILLVVARLKLRTKITNEGIFIAYPPIRKKWKKISTEEIGKYEIREYSAIREFGGYGIRKRRWRHGVAYTVSGNVGLQLWLKNGKKLLIGTQKKLAIKSAMDKLMEGERE
ncbi:MAG TPA: hypothetical protein VKA38_09715 [Draconibacterium sp.]|nr:hypothetical protein [Draconibacterium sp.]